MRDKNYNSRNRYERESPSFSSTLLDAIYRSIDEGENDEHQRCNARKKHTPKKREEIRLKVSDFERKSRSDNQLPVYLKSSPVTSCSSCSTSSDSRSSSYMTHRPKPIRTSVHVSEEREDKRQNHVLGGFVKTKSRALKIYSDLKKVKQPISPGGKLASFLNSIFTTGNAKKAKVTVSDTKSKSVNVSNCSSASSFSRSCLSKTRSNGAKRTVRFCEDEPKLIKYSMNEGLNFNLNEKKETARDLLKKYQKKVECEFNFRNEFDDDDDNDDDASYASSDLFELDNISGIGIDRYREELPVYETTYFDTNRAIANGLIM